MTPYVKEVTRFGGNDPYGSGEGSNLEQQTFFSWKDVETDGLGNVLRQPLLRRKLCFGRPERMVRGFWEDQHTYVSNGAEHRSGPHCHRCPVFDACCRLSLERIESSPQIERALQEHLDAVDHLEGNRRYRSGEPLRTWSRFLKAIRDHGGWTNINDLNVKADAIRRQTERKERRRESARRARARRRARNRPGSGEITAEFVNAIAQGHDERLKSLLALNGSPHAPAWVGKLNQDGCVRTANVWRAQIYLQRIGRKATGRSLSELLHQQGLHTEISGRSLATMVCRDLKRIRKLEDDNAGDPIWEPFDATI